jgi:hypothetical protein
MPWTPRQVRFLLSSGSPLSEEQKEKDKAELHANPALGHKRKKNPISRAKEHNGNAYH